MQSPRLRFVLPLAALVVGAADVSVAQQGPPPASQQQQQQRRPVAPPAAGRGEVLGTVLDAAGDAPIARASVAIRAKGDGGIVAGAIAAPNGSFRVQGLRPGAYSMRVTYLGFGPQVQDVVVTDSAPVVRVGVVKLSRVAAQLAGVAVVEERNAVAVEPDRNSYRAKSVAPAAANASEVLEQVPSVQVDGDGRVSLRGNENVAVQINGRPSPVRGQQLAAYLKGLPANILERVEVIPNPSAKYDPEGMAGIINIVLKENVDLGLSGSLALGVAETDRYNVAGTLGYQRGRTTVFTNLGYNADTRSVAGVNDRERLDALRAPRSFTEQDIDGETTFQGLNLGTTVDVKLSKRDLLSNALTLNRRGNDDGSLSAYSELNSARNLTDRYDRWRGADVSGLTVDYSAALKRTFAPRTHELGGELRFNHSADDERNTLWRGAPGAAQHTDWELQDTDARTKSLSAQLDYVRTLAKRTKLETGYKGTGRRIDREYLVQKDAMGTGAWVRSDLSNDFRFDEQVQALYGVLSHGVGKVELQAGLRAEHASRTFTLAEPDARYPYTYNSLFPSAVAMWAVNPATQAKVSYSRRIRRPGTQELNPFPSFFDIQNVFLGNPDLSPEYTDAIELGLTRSGKLGNVQLAPFYRHTTNVIRIDIDTEAEVDGRDVTTVSFKNLATASSWGADLNGSLRLSPKLSGFGGFNVFKMVTDGGSQSAVGSDAVAWMARANVSSELTKTFMLQGSYMYRAPMKIERGEFGAQQMATFSARQKLRGDKAVLTLRVNDPFATQKFKIRTGNDNVLQLTERNPGVRSVFLNLQLTYGQTPRVRQVQQDQDGGGPFR